MRTVNINVLSGSDTSTQNGEQIDSNQLIWASFQAVFGDATAVGTFEIQASNDIYGDKYQQPTTFVVSNWSTIQSVSVTAGATQMLLVNPITYRWLRAVYTSASGGSSTINVSMYAQSI